MIEALVPSNHTPREQALAEVLAPIGVIDPAPLETLWNAWRCPAAFLPFLAYALSVDLWDDGWDEVKKREIIAQSPAYHRRKGTCLAVEQAAAATGRETTIIEWHEFVPPQRRGTFQVYVHLRDGESVAGSNTLPVELAKLKRSIASAKPKSRALALHVARNLPSSAGAFVGLTRRSIAVLAVPPDALDLDITPRVALTTHTNIRLEAA